MPDHDTLFIQVFFIRCESFLPVLQTLLLGSGKVWNPHGVPGCLQLLLEPREPVVLRMTMSAVNYENICHIFSNSMKNLFFMIVTIFRILREFIDLIMKEFRIDIRDGLEFGTIKSIQTYEHLPGGISILPSKPLPHVRSFPSTFRRLKRSIKTFDTEFFIPYAFCNLIYRSEYRTFESFGIHSLLRITTGKNE